MCATLHVLSLTQQACKQQVMLGPHVSKNSKSMFEQTWGNKREQTPKKRKKT